MNNFELLSRINLKNGGNVFDAAISALVCNSLTQIQSMGLFGGFLLTGYINAEKKAFIVDAQMSSPKNFPVETLENVQQSVAVPGFLKGLWEVHRKHGTKSWKELIAPTLELCNEGITVTKHLHDSMYMNKRIANDSYLKKLLFDAETQKFKRPGSVIIIKKHCEFLEILANHSESEIYSGTVGDVLTSDFSDAGTFVTRDDLRGYKVKWSEAIEFPLTDGTTLLVPNTAAVLVPSILNILKQFKFNESSLDCEQNVNETIRSHHRIVEAFKHVFAARSELGDPDFVDVRQVAKRLMSPEYAEEVAQQIDDSTTFSNPEKYSAKFIAPEDHGTSHVSIIASNGDAVSVTSSINY